jgi:DNA-binding XRE family transcriptional regulator
MSKRKPIDKMQVRERRNRLLESAAKAELSLTEGVREMRAIAGMTQDEFAHHRGVSARVVKALELGQGNPTVATLNRIGQFFGLEVAFVPIKRTHAAVIATDQPLSANHGSEDLRVPGYAENETVLGMTAQDFNQTMAAIREAIQANARYMAEALDAIENRSEIVRQPQKQKEDAATPLHHELPLQGPSPGELGTEDNTGTRKRKRRLP